MANRSRRAVGTGHVDHEIHEGNENRSLNIRVIRAFRGWNEFEDANATTLGKSPLKPLPERENRVADPMISED